uniref:ABC transporter permease n=1 Tax=Thaumasiovibrio occultus TaxID=1891184 RepID=UPI000B353ED7|nr:ABC transporter permease [Thaumasiovibrio occultus]
MNPFHLLVFFAVLALPFTLFYRWKLPLNKTLLTAASRMALQLSVVGFYLQTLFDWQSLWINLAWLSVMVLVAGHTISRRAQLPLWPVLPVLAGSLGVSLLLILPLMLIGVVDVSPWWQAQYLIPITGMLLGNALSATIVGLSRWAEAIRKRKHEFDYYLTLGAPQPQLPFLREALSAAMAPQLATMATLGIVSLPGMMTGQILAGAAPLQAVQYQILIMVAIFVCASTTVALSLIILSRSSCDAYGQSTWLFEK